MPLQNRVDPWGDLTDAPGRHATLMGNRGVLHDDDGRVVRAQRSRAWITCATSFRGRRLPVMEPGANTQLFFLDEATALAAGHRPCFACRREAATAFLGLWRSAVARPDARVGELDAALSTERRVPTAGCNDGKLAVRRRLVGLPTGAMVEVRGRAWLVLAGTLLRWTHAGYIAASRRAIGEHDTGWLLTPPSSVAVLQAGYHPALHPSAGVEARPRP